MTSLNSSNKFSNDFVCLSDIDPSILQSVRYASQENFVGEKIKGYKPNKIILKRKAAQQLKKVQDYLKENGYTLVVYDAFRPKRAVQHFFEWSKNKDISTKQHYYPNLSKERLFTDGYISARSNHCKGYTVDLTIMKLGSTLQKISISEKVLKTGEKISFLDDGTIDMGTSFDFLHVASHHDSDLINESAQKNRKILKDAMLKFGFSAIQHEWWHYTLKDTETMEDYDFPIE